jgi:hypothetical protein
MMRIEVKVKGSTARSQHIIIPVTLNSESKCSDRSEEWRHQEMISRDSWRISKRESWMRRNSTP